MTSSKEFPWCIQAAMLWEVQKTTGSWEEMDWLVLAQNQGRFAPCFFQSCHQKGCLWGACQQHAVLSCFVLQPWPGHPWLLALEGFVPSSQNAPTVMCCCVCVFAPRVAERGMYQYDTLQYCSTLYWLQAWCTFHKLGACFSHHVQRESNKEFWFSSIHLVSSIQLACWWASACSWMPSPAGSGFWLRVISSPFLKLTH